MAESRISLLKDILDVTKEIATSVKNKDFDDVDALVDKREQLIKQFSDFSCDNLSKEEDDLILNIKKEKQIAVILLEQAQKSTGRELKTISGNSKAVSAYKIMQNMDPVFFNKKDM